MPDPIDVEVVQPSNGTAPVRVADGADIWTVVLYPGSLSEAIYRLGLAQIEANARWRAYVMATETITRNEKWLDLLEKWMEAERASAAALDRVRQLKEEASDG